MHYFISDDGQRRGPYTRLQIKSMVNIGLLSTGAFYRQEDSEDWIPIASFDSSPAAPSPRTQAPETADRLWKNRYTVTREKLGYIFIVSSAMIGGRRIGSSIDSQVCAVYKTWGGYPVIEYSKGIIWRTKHRLICERDHQELGYLDEASAKAEYKNFKAQSASRRGAVGGLIVSALSHLAAGALSNADGIKGFYVSFADKKGEAENMVAVGKSELIDSIVKDGS
jgi:hypothetical protein